MPCSALGSEPCCTPTSRWPWVLPAIWLVGLEGLVLAALPQPVGTWSLGGATAGLQNSGTVAMVLPVWLGAVVLVAYGLILVSAGGLRVFRADIS